MLSATEALCHIEKASPYGRGGGVADGEGSVRRIFALQKSLPAFSFDTKGARFFEKKLSKKLSTFGTMRQVII